MIPHFGVECEHCHEAVLTPILREWAEMQPAVIYLYLLVGMGLVTIEENKEQAEEILAFYEEHESHGARPCVCELEDVEEHV